MPDIKISTKPTSYWFILPWEPYHPGGVNQVVSNLYRQFEASGMEPKIWVDRWEDKAFRFESQETFKLVFRRLPGPCGDGAVKVFKYWIALPLELIRLSIIFKREKVEILNPHYPSASVLSLVILRKLGLFRGKLILSFHGSDFDEVEKASGYPLAVWRRILRGADGIVACSRSMKERIRHAFPDLKMRLHMVHNGVDLSTLEDGADKDGLPTGLGVMKYLLNIGTFDQIKGQDLLIRAFARLSAFYPWLMLVLVGRNGPTLDALRALAGSLNLESRVLFFTDVPHSRIGPFLKGATAFVLPSRMESFGIVILEAGILGIPVIASEVGGVTEILSAPELGTLVPPENVAALAGSIQSVLNDPERSKRKAENLQQHVARHFTWNRAADAYIKINTET
jgi:glycosyltransferase involved in cell wall biosynthesis